MSAVYRYSYKCFVGSPAFPREVSAIRRFLLFSMSTIKRFCCTEFPLFLSLILEPLEESFSCINKRFRTIGSCLYPLHLQKQDDNQNKFSTYFLISFKMSLSKVPKLSQGYDKKYQNKPHLKDFI